MQYGFAALIVAILVWSISQYMIGVLNSLGGQSANEIAILLTRIVGWRRGRLYSYQRAVRINYASHPLGFDETGKVDVQTVYVPLQCVEAGIRGDVYGRLRGEKRSVVIGEAGAGKSMLLKNSILAWASSAGKGSIRGGDLVPVMIELLRCNSGDADIPQLISEELIRNQVSRPKSFVEQILREGRVRLLLDGLDEISRSRRESVTLMLRDFARQYPDCQIVVTCRGTAYHGQLSPEFSQIVRIADLDDAAVRSILRASGLQRLEVESLMGALQSNPSLMRLARTPLLLAMISYLYANKLSRSGRALPASRAAFYEMAIVHLLERDRRMGREGELCAYEVNEKLPVLERLAFNIQGAGRGRDDNRTIPLSTAMTITLRVLPEVNLEPASARPLLDEIVKRSQLLVTLGGAWTEYTFRHLTLQEFLAARVLIDRPDELIKLYRDNPEAWTEVVRLWCGISLRSSTAMVKAVMDCDDPVQRVLALQCVADARQISPQYAMEVVGHFISRLGATGQEGSAVVAALASVAAAGGPRSQQLITTLASEARKGALVGTPTSRAAMLALSASGRIEAAEVLAPLAPTSDDARVALRSMGEMIVPILAERAEATDLAALDDLALIGTPAAAQTLVAELWSNDAVAVRAAWLLSQLLRSPDVEEALRHSEAKEFPAVASYDWVWEPFSRADDGALPEIAGRIAYLLDIHGNDSIPKQFGLADERIALPIAGLAMARQLHLLRNISSLPLPPELQGRAKQFSRAVGFPPSRKEITWIEIAWMFAAKGTSRVQSTKVRALGRALLQALKLDLRYQLLITHLPWPVMVSVLGAVPEKRTTRLKQRDWRTVKRNYRPVMPVGQMLIKSLTVLVVIIIGFGLYQRVTAVLGVSSFVDRALSWAYLAGLGVGIIGFVIAFIGLALDREAIRNVGGMGVIFAIIVIGINLVATIVYLLTKIGFVAALAITGVCAFLFVIAWLRSVRRSRLRANPFRQWLRAAGGEPGAARRSVIALD